MEFFTGESGRTRLALDPRTKLALVLIITTVLVTGGAGKSANAVRFVLTALPLILLAQAGGTKTTIRFAILYAVAYSCEFLLLPRVHGLPGFIVVAATGIVTRMLPGLTMGHYLVASTTISEFTAAMERMRLPRKIIIPFSVMFRFFPTIGEEARSINDAMRMRGVNVMSIEYRLVPLMMSTVKIGEELSAASLTRGLGNPVQRTNICRIGFGFQDFITLAPAVACLVCFMARL
jgi:energy-coupling factor transport system permease protein